MAAAEVDGVREPLVDRCGRFAAVRSHDRQQVRPARLGKETHLRVDPMGSDRQPEVQQRGTAVQDLVLVLGAGVVRGRGGIRVKLDCLGCAMKSPRRAASQGRRGGRREQHRPHLVHTQMPDRHDPGLHTAAPDTVDRAAGSAVVTFRRAGGGCLVPNGLRRPAEGRRVANPSRSGRTLNRAAFLCHCVRHARHRTARARPSTHLRPQSAGSPGPVVPAGQ